MAVGVLTCRFASSIVSMQDEAMSRVRGREPVWEAGRAAQVTIIRVVGGLIIMFGLLVAMG